VGGWMDGALTDGQGVEIDEWIGEVARN